MIEDKHLTVNPCMRRMSDNIVKLVSDAMSILVINFKDFRSNFLVDLSMSRKIEDICLISF